VSRYHRRTGAEDVDYEVARLMQCAAYLVHPDSEGDPLVAHLLDEARDALREVERRGG
jgi:hypothetical protein